MAQLTLSERNTLANNATFIGRVTQGIFSKANYWIVVGTPTNLKEQKQINFAKTWVLGGANRSDVYAYTRYWLANYNADPPEMEDEQPSDNAILNTAPIDVVFNTLAGVISGDELQPIQ